jgi:NAD(P)-dependent dehydrogenase (short-subunit alcohol dehydrogenase family)
MEGFAGKVAAVTGAGSGIGRELALELARRGCHVAICCDRNMEGLQETADKARALGVEITNVMPFIAGPTRWSPTTAKSTW